MGIFAAILLIAGCIGNSIFMLVAYGRYYVSADTVVDFYPFFPFGQGVLDNQFGGVHGGLLNGASLRDVQSLWLAISAAIWTSTIVTYRKLTRLAPRRAESAA